ncbi:hypothetical protein EUGRSUZ_F01370 [Eucalyptus grandis]|uniref:Uncharacterized protein n=2 Tax=Eucalyptus grandis TaxID=71139 RepID=A0A059BN08_EUCGR|nr:hypothetical protein EUGRSUZ_F01370 [Eucalyptus grandis]
MMGSSGLVGEMLGSSWFGGSVEIIVSVVPAPVGRLLRVSSFSRSPLVVCAWICCNAGHHRKLIGKRMLPVVAFVSRFSLRVV